MDRVGNAIPFNFTSATRAYGKPMTVRPLDGPPGVPAVGKQDPAGPVGSIRAAATDSARAAPASDPSRLIAARVDPIDLSRDVDTIEGKPTSSGAYPLYRHPADQNLAATGVEIGRSLDVQG
ncbi:MAG: hypothetical protein AAGA55_09710 [Planctomycetota bacterium]